jgi:hypothetical protein
MAKLVYRVYAELPAEAGTPTAHPVIRQTQQASKRKECP